MEKKKSLEGNDSQEFEELTAEEKDVLLEWIGMYLKPIKRFNYNSSSYGLKHIFQFSEKGFYVTNGAFKGAMLKAGFKAHNKHEMNWYFNISKKMVRREK